jgi:hypothetical protein
MTTIIKYKTMMINQSVILKNIILECWRGEGRILGRG